MNYVLAYDKSKNKTDNKSLLFKLMNTKYFEGY